MLSQVESFYSDFIHYEEKELSYLKSLFYMKQLTIFALLLFNSFLIAQDVNIPDSAFLSALISEGVDINGDNVIQISEAEIKDSLWIDRKGISDLTGIQAFTNLVYMHVDNNLLTEVDLSQNTELRILDISGNSLKQLDLSQNTKIYLLYCFDNELTSLDLSNNALNQVKCYRNNLTSIDLRNNFDLFVLECYENELLSLELSQNTKISRLICDHNKFETLDLARLHRLTTLSCSNNELSALDVTKNEDLRFLDCEQNNLEQIDLSQNSELEDLRVNTNQLTSLDLSNNPVLETIQCDKNNIEELNVDNCRNLSSLSFADNKVERIDLSSCERLFLLNAFGNQLRNIDLSVCSLLSNINVGANQLTELNLTSNEALFRLSCHDNPIEILDLSQASGGIFIEEVGPGLKYLNLSNGNIDLIDFLYLDDDDQVAICVDGVEEISNLQQSPSLEDEKVAFSEACNFPPYFWLSTNTMEGSIRFDASGDCDDNSTLVSNFLDLQFDLDTAVYSVRNVGTSGSYGFPVPHGSYTVLSSLSNNAFQVTPQLVDVDLTMQEKISQDFCISPTANLTENVSIKIIPLDTPRPGFESSYKIVIRNIGNTAATGEFYFYYDSEHLEYLSSDPEMMLSEDYLLYSFEELLPFEEEEIHVTFRLNSPMDTPPLNNGDVINFKGYVDLYQGTRDIGIQACLDQEVVNSYDPNDKRCLQGEYLLDTLVGGYIDYMIRFENTGTASAVNVLIEDEIDQEVFNISTLRLVDASHEVQVIVEEDKASFVFADIDLPFEDDFNDGYVVFEIQTLDNLEKDRVLSNNAEIFFDFNFPIITNTFVTTVVSDADLDGFHHLEDCDDNNAMVYPGAPEIAGNDIDEDCDGEFLSTVSDVDSTLPFAIYPNPAQHAIYIESLGLTDYLVELYSMEGQLLISGINERRLGVEDYDSGLYLLGLSLKETGEKYYLRIIIQK